MPNPSDAPTVFDYHEQVLLHLGEIEKYTQALTKLIPEESKTIAATFAEFYVKHESKNASVHVGATPQAVETAALQRALAAPQRAGLPAKQGQAEWDEADAGVYGTRPSGGSGAPSPSASVGGTPTGWRGNVTSTLGKLPLPHMQGAVITPAEQLQFFSSIFANMAGRKEQSLQKELANLDAQKEPLSEAEATRAAAIKDQLANFGGGLSGKLSDTFGSMAAGYTQGKYISSSLKNIFTPFANMRDLGYQTGYQGGGPGFLGIRMPWDGGAAAGMGQYASAMGFAFNNSVTPGQAHTIYSNLFANGWMGGSQTDKMRNAAAQIMRTNPYIGSSPTTYQMMDQATRMGVTSLQEFVDTMSKVPNAALAAHTSIAQTMSDMTQIGSISQSQGSNVQQGYNLAQAWQQTTGLPGAVLAPALTNPMVQAQTYMDTGLMPMMQGLAPAGSRIGAVMETVNRMANTVISPGKKTLQGSGGFSQTISPFDQKVALMAQFFPGWDTNTLKKIMRNSQGITTGANIAFNTEAWQQASKGAGDNTQKLNALLGAGPGHWQTLLGQLRNARYIDSQGQVQKMFSSHQLKGLQGIRANDIQSWLSHQLGSGHPDSAALKQVAQGQLPAKLAQRILRDRQSQIMKDIGANTKNQSNAGKTVVSLKLTGAAQKLFAFSSPQGSGKGQGNAGQININVPYANGWTQPPTSDANTYNYGSQYSTGQGYSDGQQFGSTP